MPTDPRTIRSHTFATEGPTPPVMRTAELAAQATGQAQAVHSHPHGSACWPAEDPGGVCLLVLPDLSREVLVPARPDVSAPTLHAPVLADEAEALGLTRPGLPGDLIVAPLDGTGQVAGDAVVFPGGSVVQDPTNWPDAGDVLDPGGYSADPPSSHDDLLEDPEGNAAAGLFPSAGVNGGPVHRSDAGL